jgi:hypothetical protein
VAAAGDAPPHGPTDLRHARRPRLRVRPRVSRRPRRPPHLDDGTLHVEVALPEALHAEAGRHGLHPALLDAALHAAALAVDGGELRIPFAWREVRRHRTGATALRVRLTVDDDTARLEATDVHGHPVLSVGGVAGRPIDAAQLRAAGAQPADGVLSPVWTTVGAPAAGEPASTAVLGDLELAGAEAHAGLAELVAALGPDEAPPGVVVAALPVPDQASPGAIGTALPAPDEASPGAVATALPAPSDDLAAPARARAAAAAALALVRAWLAEDRLASSRLVVVTRRAVAAVPGERPDPAAAAASGLLRSAQSEHPGRIAQVDLEPGAPLRADALRAGADEPQLAVRDGALLAPRLARPAVAGLETTRDGAPWVLAAPERGTLEGLRLVPAPRAAAALQPGEVRVAMRAAGVNFRDLMVALGLVDAGGAIGGEGAGVVLEVAPDVTRVAPGDRVLGLTADAFGPVAVTDERLVVPMPDGWSFARAAAVPIVTATAWYALAELAAVQPGERVLVHAGAGGVGIVAVQIARHLGAEVFATASPAKWGRPAGARRRRRPPCQLARDAGFRAQFPRGHRRRGRRRRAQRAGARARRRLARAAAPRRALRRDGQDRHPRRRRGRRRAPGRPLPRLRRGRGRARRAAAAARARARPSSPTGRSSRRRSAAGTCARAPRRSARCARGATSASSS